MGLCRQERFHIVFFSCGFVSRDNRIRGTNQPSTDFVIDLGVMVVVREFNVGICFPLLHPVLLGWQHKMCIKGPNDEQKFKANEMPYKSVTKAIVSVSLLCRVMIEDQKRVKQQMLEKNVESQLKPMQRVMCCPWTTSHPTGNLPSITRQPISSSSSFLKQ